MVQQEKSIRQLLIELRAKFYLKNYRGFCQPIFSYFTQEEQRRLNRYIFENRPVNKQYFSGYNYMFKQYEQTKRMIWITKEINKLPI